MAVFGVWGTGEVTWKLADCRLSSTYLTSICALGIWRKAKSAIPRNPVAGLVQRRGRSSNKSWRLQHLFRFNWGK